MTLLELVRAALKEDMPHGDLTTDSLAQLPRPGQARLVAKEDLILSGTAPFELTINSLDQDIIVKWHFEEGQAVPRTESICTLQGDLLQLLRAERVALNFIGHLSGIATLTQRFVAQVAHTKTKILDTRKTTPGYRDLEKRAVVHGGGLNHRRDLSESILLKDNHIHMMGGITAAVKRVRQHSMAPVIVEAANIEMVKEAVSLKVNRILLDNMSNEQIREALALIPAPIETEASGNMALERVKSVAELGVHYISVGALTHSAAVADMSLLFQW